MKLWYFSNQNDIHVHVLISSTWWLASILRRRQNNYVSTLKYMCPNISLCERVANKFCSVNERKLVHEQVIDFDCLRHNLCVLEELLSNWKQAWKPSYPCRCSRHVQQCEAIHCTDIGQVHDYFNVEGQSQVVLKRRQKHHGNVASKSSRWDRCRKSTTISVLLLLKKQSPNFLELSCCWCASCLHIYFPALANKAIFAVDTSLAFCHKQGECRRLWNQILHSIASTIGWTVWVRLPPFFALTIDSNEAWSTTMWALGHLQHLFCRLRLWSRSTRPV